MAHDISPEDNAIWAARTTGGMVFVAVDSNNAEMPSGADLVILRDDAGNAVPARMIGPVGGDGPTAATWRVERRFRIDPGGEPLSAMISDTMSIDRAASGHDWGALGLPDGLATRVLSVGEPPTMTEAALALASSGHRLGEATWWLTLAPGDRVSFDAESGTVIAIDRRKRTVEVEIDGEATFVSLDDLHHDPA